MVGSRGKPFISTIPRVQDINWRGNESGDDRLKFGGVETRIMEEKWWICGTKGAKAFLNQHHSGSRWNTKKYEAIRR